jgi:excisionase family DNA binding protein
MTVQVSDIKTYKSDFKKCNRDQFLTTYELMSMLKIKNKQTIYKLIGQGLPVVMVGKQYRFITQEVIDFLKQKSISALADQIEKRYHKLISHVKSH